MTTPNELRAIAERLRRACDPFQHGWRHERDELGKQAADAITSLLADLEAAEARVGVLEKALRPLGYAHNLTDDDAQNARTALANSTEEARHTAQSRADGEDGL